MKELALVLEKNLKQFFEKTPTQKCIIGLSGGVDSAVTACIAVKALGKENVFGVLMPYKLGEISSFENFEDAKNLSEILGIEKKIIEIDEFVAPYKNLFRDGSLAFANTLARIRMTILFGYANDTKSLVLGTCNKSEVMLGYETKFGDGAADVSVIGNLWKTQVWELAKYYHLPENFITKTPSAELFVGHSDEEEMGFSYHQADETLKKIDSGTTSFKNPLEQKIYQMFLNSAHKREFIPTINIQ